MEPMPIRKRRVYFLILLAAFFVLIPAILLPVSGYRLTDDLRLVKTGGIYVTAPFSGTEIFVNNSLGKTTNLIQRNFFEQNLAPGTYFVFVYKEGYSPWSKELSVHEQIVSEAHAFLVPREPLVEEISKTISLGKAVSPNPEYRSAMNLFLKKPATSTLSSLTASATSSVERNDVLVKREADIALYAEWLGNLSDAPYYFCDEYKKNCLKTVFVFSSPSKIKTFDFLPGRNDVFVIARKNGIYAVEADRRRIQNFSLVYAGGDPDFRIGNDGKFYVKDGESLYRLKFSI